MANIHPNPKDSPSGLSTQDSTAMYSFINSQTLPLTRQHSKSLLPIQHSSPPDAPLNSAATGPPDLHRPLSDPGLLKEQHWLSRLQDVTQLFHWKYKGHFKTGTGQKFNTNARFSTGTRLYIRFLCDVTSFSCVTLLDAVEEDFEWILGQHFHFQEVNLS